MLDKVTFTADSGETMHYRGNSEASFTIASNAFSFRLRVQAQLLQDGHYAISMRAISPCCACAYREKREKTSAKKNHVYFTVVCSDCRKPVEEFIIPSRLKLQLASTEPKVSRNFDLGFEAWVSRPNRDPLEVQLEAIMIDDALQAFLRIKMLKLHRAREKVEDIVVAPKLPPAGKMFTR